MKVYNPPRTPVLRDLDGSPVLVQHGYGLYYLAARSLNTPIGAILQEHKRVFFLARSTMDEPLPLKPGVQK